MSIGYGDYPSTLLHSLHPYILYILCRVTQGCKDAKDVRGCQGGNPGEAENPLYEDKKAGVRL